MPRDANGNYTLPPGNPVVTGTIIETSWANPTMSDVAAEITNSLDRDGRGGMRAAFRFAAGSKSAPGITWVGETGSGFYRALSGDMRATIAGVDRMRWTGTTVDVWDGTNWVPLVTDNVIGFLSPSVNVTITGTWSFAQPLTVSNALNVTGLSTLAAVNATNLALSGTLGVAAQSTFTGNSQFNGTATFNNQVSVYESRPLYFYSAGQATSASLSMANASTFQINMPASGSSMAFLFNGVNSVSMGQTQLSVLSGGYLSLYDSANTGQMNITCLNNQGFVTGNIDSFTAQIGAANRFSVSSSGSSFLAGAAVVFYAPNNTVYTTHRVEDGGSAYWSGTGVTQYQWYFGGTLAFTVSPTIVTVPEASDLVWAGNGAGFKPNTVGSSRSAVGRDSAGWKGPVLYHNDSALAGGRVYQGVVGSAPSTAQAGDIYYEYE